MNHKTKKNVKMDKLEQIEKEIKAMSEVVAMLCSIDTEHLSEKELDRLISDTDNLIADTKRLSIELKSIKFE